MRPRLQISVCAGRTGSCVVELRGSIPDLLIAKPATGGSGVTRGRGGRGEKSVDGPMARLRNPLKNAALQHPRAGHTDC